MTTVVETFPRKVVCLDPVFIPMSDGTRLAATIWLPEDAGDRPVPAILELIPYRRRDGTVFRDMKMHPYVAGHGFACCRVDIRGSGDSEGVLPDEYTEQEFDDACEIIAWLAAQSWSSGSVGMTGISWGGFNALQVAARQPPALKAIIALCCSDDRYADDVHYFGGCLLTEDGMWSSLMLAMGALPPDPQIVGDRWRDMWRERLEATTCWSSTWMRHQRRDAYWKRGSVCEDFAKIKIPVYAISGWDDTYSNAVPRLLEGLTGPRKGLVGPWTHVYPFLGNPGPAIGYLQEAVRWWRQWLEGVDTGVMDGPLYTAWLNDPHAPAPFYPEHAGRFVGEPSWPTPNVESMLLHLNADGLGPEARDGRAMLLCSPVTAGRDCGRYGGYGGTVPDMAIDQRREDGLGLCFDTVPLKQDFDLLGAPVVQVTGISDSELGFIVARLCEVAPDGTSTLVTWGVLNLAHRQGHEHPEPLVPGQEFKARIELNHIGRRFAAGNRLRLVLSNQHWPILWPTPGMPSITMESGSSRLLLPVRRQVPGEVQIEFAPAEMSPPVSLEVLRDEEHRRDIAIDGGSGRQTITLASDEGRVHLTDRSIVTGARVVDRMSITEGDPLSALLETGWELSVESGEAQVETRSHLTIGTDGERFQLSWKLEVFERGILAFERGGDEWIDRDHI
ncbi:CocE/NonD family hydrolase [Rhizobiaceae bacterium n13]|uniref:CocE/NonD family hydrolase n=1 Tax=Ferirhizobium litorale TaxID=2927786 RepID=A0AAE3QCH9_9HYPH|nr:CocE/NonD family hydrolase [Fererhizobium litorale]MDI7862127.1 CocE/NonD family hydrolase [Fererhizobium litorale]MDI7922600.1 CocE/NonD family hydrolase [Fererhizobium litorale]